MDENESSMICGKGTTMSLATEINFHERIMKVIQWFADKSKMCIILLIIVAVENSKLFAKCFAKVPLVGYTPWS